MTPGDKSAAVRRIAASLGFERVGIAPSGRVRRADYLGDWLARGCAGRMDYLNRRLEQRVHPGMLLDRARSVIVVALNYHQTHQRRRDDKPRGRVARYAWGDDYHKIVKARLRTMIDRLGQAIDEPFEARACVDTAPILEREWAAAAGIGWIGKNTMVLHPRLGSYFFLGEIVTTLELPADAPATDHCGTCTRCLEACPTAALTDPYRMDATRCISYLTVELGDDIPADFHAAIGDWIFGCDICQEVCPHNRRVPTSTAFSMRGPGPYPALNEVLTWTSDDYRAVLRGSAIKRAKLSMLKRNAVIALANQAPR